jgi:hypothetical protein
MRRSDLFLFSVILAYLLSGWTGFPGLTGFSDQSLRFQFHPGFFEILSIENRFLDEMQDPLVESDSRPERLFNHVHRHFTQNLVLASAFAFLIVFTLLTIVAGFTQRWFYPQMKRMVYLPVSLYLLFSLLLTPKEPPPLATDFLQQLLYFGPLVFKSALLFLSTAGWMAPAPEFRERDFLSFLRRERPDMRRALRDRIAPAVLDLFLISVIGAVITNVILLPFFLVQIHFAEYFAFVLIPGLVLLAVYYVNSYHKVAMLRGEDASWGAALAFLSFRMMRNFLYLTALVLVVVFVLGAILSFSYSNLNVLIKLGIVSETPGL